MYETNSVLAVGYSFVLRVPAGTLPPSKQNRLPERLERLFFFFITVAGFRETFGARRVCFLVDFQHSFVPCFAAVFLHTMNPNENRTLDEIIGVLDRITDGECSAHIITEDEIFSDSSKSLQSFLFPFNSSRNRQRKCSVSKYFK